MSKQPDHITGRVFFLPTDGGAPNDGAWYWQPVDAHGDDDGEPVGPYDSAEDVVLHNTECAWCGGPRYTTFPNRRGELCVCYSIAAFIGRWSRD